MAWNILKGWKALFFELGVFLKLYLDVILEIIEV